LVDTSVWVDHLRSGDAQLAGLLERGGVVMHPFVIGEIACGSLTHRSAILELLQELPTAAVAESEEVLGFIERHALHGKGIGYVDAHLLASVALTQGASLWTRDKRLQVAADDLGCSWQDTSSH
jgi:predicted nucleic acid-binding protein